MARRSHAHDQHDRQRRMAAKEELTYPAVRFTQQQVACIARGIAEIRGQLNLVLYALAVMPDHVHIVVPRQSYKAEELCGIYKRAALRQLRREGLHPFLEYAQQGQEGPLVAERAKPPLAPPCQGESITPESLARPSQSEPLTPASLARPAKGGPARLPTPWAEYGWRIYLHTPAEVLHAIRYVERNPIVARLPAQPWDFMTPYT